MRQTDVIVSRGVLGGGPLVVEYYTSQPTPSQWVAVAVVNTGPEGPVADDPPRMVVGTGASEADAVTALCGRLSLGEEGAARPRDEEVATHAPPPLDLQAGMEAQG